MKSASVRLMPKERHTSEEEHKLLDQIPAMEQAAIALILKDRELRSLREHSMEVVSVGLLNRASEYINRLELERVDRRLLEERFQERFQESLLGAIKEAVAKQQKMYD